MDEEPIRTCCLCFLKEEEVSSFLNELKSKYRSVSISLLPLLGGCRIVFQSRHSVDPLIEEVRGRFPTFFYGEGKIEEAVHRELIDRKKTVALAESCTGGAIAARLTSLPGASEYFLGSIVAYANSWKERFLHVSRTTLEKKGAVSPEAVIEMVEGLLRETDADYGAAVSGIAGPGGGTLEKPVGTIYIAIQERGKKVDAGSIHVSLKRREAIDLSVDLVLGALWRRIVHERTSFS